jgi:hypothetical protein
MGVVYEAFDAEHDRHVALKTLRHPSGEDLFRLKAEFRALQDVHHPNLVALGELHEERGAWFFTMELVEGVSFLEWVRGDAGGAPPPTTGSGRSGDTPAEVIGTAGTWRSTAAQRLWDAATAPQRCDLERLRPALGQLGAGLFALHAAGKVHRDIKPSNVLVTPAGRVALLDFGLVTGTALEERSSVAHTVGTIAYMAPEQAAARPVGPAADWYSVGAMLFEALTGSLPFDGPPLAVMVDKQTHDGPAPSTRAPEVPADLDQLCRDLLRRDPEARPDGSAILARLGVAAAAPPAPTTTAVSLGLPYVGRQSALAALRGAFAIARGGTPQAVLVGGESGVGKTTLVRWFTDRLREEVPGLVVLAGRCYEREFVPFRALDGVIDALSRFMVQVGDAEAGSLLPRAAGLLGQVFPVLRRVKAIAQAPRPDPATDPQELRQRLFGAMRELLTRLADRHPVVIVIDDLQWADADSLALAAEVVRPPDAPGLLLLGTRRNQRTGSRRRRTPEVAPLQPGFMHHIALGRLAREEALLLATRLAERTGAPAAFPVEAIAQEAGGHPLFIDELVRHAAVQPMAAGVPLRLDDVLRARVAALPAAARRVLELTAVAGTPRLQTVVERAADLGADELQRCVAALRAVNLVATTSAPAGDTLAPYHDRVREAVLASLEPAVVESHHRDLALALEAGEHPDPEQLAVHWHGAGEDAHAARHYEAAAVQAETALAFDHAAAMYQAALDRRLRDDGARQLRIRLGNALANAGRGAQAAATFLDAAEGAPAVEVLELTRRAAEQYLRSGHLDEGLGAIRQVLAAMGMTFPGTPRRALLSTILRRARVRLRGLGFRLRAESQIAPEELARIDAAFSIAGTLGPIDAIRGTDFNSRFLLAALRIGEPRRLVRALALEAIYVAADGPTAAPRSRRLLALADSLIGPRSDEMTRVYPRVAEGMALYFQGAFRESLAVLQRCEEPLRGRCQGGAWELDQTIVYSLFARTYLGELREVAQRVPQHLAEALDRGDLYLATVLSLSILNATWLFADDPAVARRMAERAIARWSFQGSVVHNWYAPTALTQLLIYEGDGPGALTVIERAWPGLGESMLLRVDLVRAEARQLRARAALAAAAAGGPEAERRRRIAARDAEWLRRQRSPWMRALGELALAGVASSAGAAARAVEHLLRAETDLEALHLALHAAAARRHRGRLVGGDEGRRLVDEADRWMAGQRVKRPDRLAAMVAPGFPE